MRHWSAASKRYHNNHSMHQSVPKTNIPPQQGSRCNHCGACLAVCPVYDILRMECLAPRGRSHLLTEISEGRLPSELGDVFLRAMDTCIQCGACTASCKAGEDTAGRVLKARAQIKELHSLPKWAWHLLENRKLLDWALPILSLVPQESGLLFRLLGLFRHGNDSLRLRIKPVSKTALDSLDTKTSLSTPHKHGHLTDLRIAFFIGCVQNYLYPQVAEAITRIIGASLWVPKEQGCCGMPAWTNGNPETARELALNNIKALTKIQPHIIITGCASCADMLKNKWPILTQSQHTWEVLELSQFLLRYNIMPSLNRTYSHTSIYAHTPCHQKFGLRDPNSLTNLLQQVMKENVATTDGCCGGGGLFAMKHTEISGKILQRQIEGLSSEDQAPCIVTTCSGCLLQWRELPKAMNLPIQAIHLAELFV